MPDNRNRKRPIQVKFFVDENELGMIKAKMAQLGTDNMSAYLRKMAIDGYVVKLDTPELCELTSQMKRISSNENQIAKRLNATGNIYEADIEEIKKNQEEIYEGIRKVLDSLSKIEYCSAPTVRSRFLRNRSGVWGHFPNKFARVYKHEHCLPSAFRSWQIMRSGYRRALLAR